MSEYGLVIRTKIRFLTKFFHNLGRNTEIMVLNEKPPSSNLVCQCFGGKARSHSLPDLFLIIKTLRYESTIVSVY